MVGPTIGVRAKQRIKTFSTPLVLVRSEPDV